MSTELLLEWTPEVDQFNSLAGWFSATRPDGVEVAQARVSYTTDREHTLSSDVYELVRAADFQPFNVNTDGSFPVHNLTHAHYAERAAQASAARARMTKHQRSARDMEAIAAQLRRDAAYHVSTYERQVEQAVIRQRKHDEATALVLQIDVELLSSEQRQQLAALFGYILKEK